MLQEDRYQKGMLVMKDSPFIWRKNQVLCCENKNTNCSFEQIENMKNKGYLNEIDFMIMEQMAAYRYLLLSHVDRLVNESGLKAGYKKQRYDKNMSKLVSAGIVSRYCFAWRDDESWKSPGMKSSVRFYDLSKGAYTYVRDVLGKKAHHIELEQKDERILEWLSLSQFDIGLSRNIKEMVKYRGYGERKRVGSSYIDLDLYYKINLSSTTLSLLFNVVSIRDIPLSENRLSEKLKILKSYNMIMEKEDHAVTLVLCESMESVNRLYHHLSHDEVLSNENIFFTTDIMNYVFGTESSLLNCKYIEEFISIDRLKIDLI